jgi:sugar O-acyltransferase (sialic acid O-acetyltransferase NeuD family)
MLIIGAKGFAKEVLEVLNQLGQLDYVAFYDDVTDGLPDTLYDQFPIITRANQALNYFENISNKFTLGLGDSITRYKMFKKMQSLGGVLSSTISPYAVIGHYGVIIQDGCNIMTGTVITNDISIGTGCLINLNCTIGHDVTIGKFVELSPGVAISGGCKIGNFCTIGTNATVLPKINIGNNVIIGAGAVVTKDIPDNCLAVGVPAQVIKTFPPPLDL